MAEAYTVRQLSTLRKVIAARMTEAKRTIPHFRLSMDMELDALFQLRKELQQSHPDASVTLNDLVIKATASALMDEPAVNIQWVDGEIHQYTSADISIIVATEGGLVNPILRQAESKSVWEISREVAGIKERALKNRLKMSELEGGSFSISNLGMYGVDQFDAIINPPQCAILAIPSAKPQAVVSPERETRIASVARMTLSLDHRALDGVAGAKFLAALKHRIEHPEELKPA